MTPVEDVKSTIAYAFSHENRAALKQNIGQTLKRLDLHAVTLATEAMGFEEGYLVILSAPDWQHEEFIRAMEEGVITCAMTFELPAGVCSLVRWPS